MRVVVIKNDFATWVLQAKTPTKKIIINK